MRIRLREIMKLAIQVIMGFVVIGLGLSCRAESYTFFDFAFRLGTIRRLFVKAILSIQIVVAESLKSPPSEFDGNIVICKREAINHEYWGSIVDH